MRIHPIDIDKIEPSSRLQPLFRKPARKMINDGQILFSDADRSAINRKTQGLRIKPKWQLLNELFDLRKKCATARDKKPIMIELIARQNALNILEWI